MDGIDLLIVIGRVLVVFVILLGTTVLNVWIERKVLAKMQNRVGPNRAGPWGLLQTVADGLKLFFKESITPRKVEYGIFVTAPFLAIIPAFLIFMVVPFGRPFTIGGHEVILQGADLNVGVLFILAMSSLAVYAVVLAGWSSGSKYPLLGGVRATAQAISYEAAMGLAMVAVVMFSSTSGDGGTLSLAGIVERQAGTFADVFPNLAAIAQFIPRWNLIPQFVAFRDLLHGHHRRDQSIAVRPGRGRAGAGGRIPHRVLGDALCHVSARRVLQHLLDVRHLLEPVPGRMERSHLGRHASRLHLWRPSDLLALRQDLRPVLHPDLAAGHAASDEIRPADAAGMEAAHSRAPWSG